MEATLMMEGHSSGWVLVMVVIIARHLAESSGQTLEFTKNLMLATVRLEQT